VGIEHVRVEHVKIVNVRIEQGRWRTERPPQGSCTSSHRKWMLSGRNIFRFKLDRYLRKVEEL
jgi:hypothetical protein